MQCIGLGELVVEANFFILSHRALGIVIPSYTPATPVCHGPSNPRLRCNRLWWLFSGNVSGTLITYGLVRSTPTF